MNNDDAYSVKNDIFFSTSPNKQNTAMSFEEKLKLEVFYCN